MPISIMKKYVFFVKKIIFILLFVPNVGIAPEVIVDVGRNRGD